MSKFSKLGFILALTSVIMPVVPPMEEGFEELPRGPEKLTKEEIVKIIDECAEECSRGCGPEAKALIEQFKKKIERELAQ